MDIYEYVHWIGNTMFPAYEIEEDGKEYQAVRTYEQRTTIRYQVSEISAFYPDCW